jgi:NitT/TauT family transport system substrate-binding protein
MPRLDRVALALLIFVSFTAVAQVETAELPVIRVGVLKFGTVNWLLQTMQERGFAEAEAISLEVVPLASKSATTVALQGQAVDLIVSDWLWVSRQRHRGQPYTFVPYSLAVGAVMVWPDAGIDELEDLQGRRLGIAGGALDKSWLLLRAYARKTLGLDLKDMVKADFAAPPLLNELIMRGELQAAINFWHYAARLKAAGMKELIAVEDILPALGVAGNLPLIGWVFDERWADEHRSALEAFLRAANAAQGLLAKSDQAWDSLRPAMHAENEAAFEALRKGYRAGIPRGFGTDEIEAARRAFVVLADEGGEAMVGGDATLAPGTFWAGYSLKPGV